MAATDEPVVGPTGSWQGDKLSFPTAPSDFAPRMLSSELIMSIQRCSIGDKEQLQDAAELAAIFIEELTELITQRPQLMPQVFRQALPACQHFLHRTKMISPLDSGKALRNANRLLGAASQFVALAAEQHPLLLKQEGTIDVAVDCMTALFNEGRPGMLLEEDIVKAQRALISTMLELAEASGQGRSDLLMAVFRGMTLRDHLCWVWRMGSDSADPVLAEAALLAAQLLRVLGVEHDSLDTMLCQAPPQMVDGCRKPLSALPVSTTASDLADRAWSPRARSVERGLRAWLRSAASLKRPYALVTA